MSHVKSGDATHTIITSLKMAWLILDTEMCDVTDRIDVATDVYVKVSRTSAHVAPPS
jgi:hypothetical protein